MKKSPRVTFVRSCAGAGFISQDGVSAEDDLDLGSGGFCDMDSLRENAASSLRKNSFHDRSLFVSLPYSRARGKLPQLKRRNDNVGERPNGVNNRTQTEPTSFDRGARSRF